MKKLFLLISMVILINFLIGCTSIPTLAVVKSKDKNTQLRIDTKKIKPSDFTSIYKIKTSSDDKYIIMITKNLHVFLINTISGNLINNFKINSNSFSIGTVGVSEDCLYVYKIYKMRKIKIWNTVTGKLTKVISSDQIIKSVKVNSKNKHMVIALGNSTQIWKFLTGKMIHEFKVTFRNIKAVKFSKDGNRLFSFRVNSRGDTGYCHIYDLKDMKLHKKIAINKVADPIGGTITRAIVCDNFQYLALDITGPRKLTLTLDIEQDKKIVVRKLSDVTGSSIIITPPSSVYGPSNIDQMALLHNNKLAVAYDVYNSLVFYDLEADAVLHEIRPESSASIEWEKTKSFSASNNGKTFIYSHGKLAQIYDSKTFTQIGTLLFSNRNWAVIAHNGLYDGSQGILNKFQWKTGKERIPLSDFDKSFHTKGLLKKLIDNKINKIHQVSDVLKQLVGKVHKIANKEIVISIKRLNQSLKIGDQVFIVLNGEKIYLNIYFPMMTSAKCKLKHNKSLKYITPGMPVFID